MSRIINETSRAHAAQAARTARTARTPNTGNTGKLTEITQGSWEAEGKVIVVRPENKLGGPSRTLLLYEASVMDYGEPKSSGMSSQKAKLESELEVNARAIAAVPDMLSLLKDLLIIATTSGNMPRNYDLKIVELLLNIYGTDSVIIDKDCIILTRETLEDGNHSESNCRDDREDHYEKQVKSAKQPKQSEKSDNFVFHGECRNCKYREECECADYDYEDDEDNDEDEDEDIDTDSVEDDDNRDKCRVKHYIFQL